MRFALAVRPEGALPPLYTNAYVVFDPASGDAVLIDPGADDPRLRDFVQARDLKVKAVLNTHGHADHRGGNAAMASQFGAPVYITDKDAGFYEAKPENTFRSGEVLEFGNLKVRVLSTPGHTAGSACFLIGNRLFSGDTLFRNDIGKVGADNPRQTPELRKAMIRRIRDSLLVLPGDADAVDDGDSAGARIDRRTDETARARRLEEIGERTPRCADSPDAGGPLEIRPLVPVLAVVEEDAVAILREDGIRRTVSASSARGSPSATHLMPMRLSSWLTIITIAVGAFAVGFNSNLVLYLTESMDGDYLSADPSEARSTPIHWMMIW